MRPEEVLCLWLWLWHYAEVHVLVLRGRLPNPRWGSEDESSHCWQGRHGNQTSPRRGQILAFPQRKCVFCFRFLVGRAWGLEGLGGFGCWSLPHPGPSSLLEVQAASMVGDIELWHTSQVLGWVSSWVTMSLAAGEQRSACRFPF